MSFHYLIDGYNVLYAFPKMPPGTWEARRNALLQWLAKEKPHGNNAVTVVFDSHEGTGNRMRQGEMEVVYTAGETADDWISAQARTAKNPRALVVISNDKGIRDLVRGTGARWMSAESFIQKKSSRQVSPVEKPKLDDITKEFEDRWLKDKP
jgi:predicted RNA-binding protein with PIN domain